MAGILLGPRFNAGTVTPGDVSLGADSVASGGRRGYWRFGSDGFTYKSTSTGSYVAAQAWINPRAGMEQFEVKASLGSGDALSLSSALDTWISGATSPEWGYASAGAKTGVLLISIRRISDGVLLVTDVEITIETEGAFGGDIHDTR